MRANIEMTAPQYVIIGSKLYFGGGQTHPEKQTLRKIIYEFDPFATNEPVKRVVPDCPVIHFGLGNIGGELVIIGGRMPDSFSSLSDKVYVLKKSLSGVSEWQESVIPDLCAPRARVCVISEKEDGSSTCIAACGGRTLNDESNEVSSNLVEVYRIGAQEWVRVTPLPKPRAALRVTCLHGTAYLLGGYGNNMKNESTKECFTVITAYLFGENTRIVWKQLSELPTSSSAPGHLCGTLLALGGEIKTKSPVLAFNQNLQEWVHIANLPKNISSATAAVLPNQKVIIFGGWEKTGVRNTDILIGQVSGQMY